VVHKFLEGLRVPLLQVASCKNDKKCSSCIKVTELWEDRSSDCEEKFCSMDFVRTANVEECGNGWEEDNAILAG
jgi:hypothetical protein